jgi:alpha-D-xyloside xylohydrolase
MQAHNLYTYWYNQTVFELLERKRGQDAVVFARSATAGSQKMPVHWGGDNSSNFDSLAETLRGGLSLGVSGFGFWSHDIGGFEGTPNPDVFKRWLAFGLMSSHSRLHGNESVRVPWSVDEESVAVTKRFVELKAKLMPYLYSESVECSKLGLPLLRPIFMEHPEDPTSWYLDRQYMLGSKVLIAPVMRADGTVQFYLPKGEWVRFETGEQVSGGVWLTETHDYFSLPMFVRAGSLLPLSEGPADFEADFTKTATLKEFGPVSVNDSVWVYSRQNPSGLQLFYKSTE